MILICSFELPRPIPFQQDKYVPTASQCFRREVSCSFMNLIYNVLVAKTCSLVLFSTPSVGVVSGRAVQPPTRQLIIGGTSADRWAWPWQAGVMVADQLICGGTLIQYDIVLTAAHCLMGRRYHIQLNIVITVMKYFNLL